MTDSSRAARTSADRSNPVRYTALAMGVAFLAIGLLGFIVTGFDEFAGRTRETLLGFELNPLHNIVHILFGVAGVLMWRRLDTARAYGWLVVVAYGVVLIYGLVVANRESGNILSINTADNFLHLLFIVLGLFVALFPVRERVART